ncbi:MAG: hypothetical protein BWZ02_02289 [Lentisphaerae bacterium ADurb.BinA184]|nr:MAG: hypothetical protein BWZ02_02289 [Lentisphaerae bacterium ADurb.BinA184]
MNPTRVLSLSVLVAAVLLAGAVALRADDLTWNTGNGDWDDATSNWNWNLEPTTYTDGGVDNVTFDDVAGTGGTIAIQDLDSSGGVTPLSTTVSGALNYTFSGASILGGTLNKSGSGALTLANAANSFSGINLGGGVLGYANGNCLGSGTITFSDNAKLFYNSPAAAPVTLPNAIQIANGKTATIELDHNSSSTLWQIAGLISGGTPGSPVTVRLIERVLGLGNFDPVTLTNTGNSFVGTLEIAQRTEFVYQGNDTVFGPAGNTITVNGAFAILNMGGFTLNRNVTSSGVVKNGTIAGVVSGGIYPQGTVRLTNNANAINSFIQISSNGVLAVDDPRQLGGGSYVALMGTASPGTLRVLGTPTANFTNQLFVETDGGFVEVVDPSAVVNWTGPVYTRTSGPTTDKVTKLGAGTLTLSSFSQVNTTSPISLVVQSGRLNVTDAAPPAGSFSDITVMTGATLGGTGRISLATGKTVTVNAGGTLAPGMSAGTLTVSGGPVNFAADSIFTVEINGTAVGQYDRLVVTPTGSVTAADGALLALDFDPLFTAAVGDIVYILDNQTASPILDLFQYGEGDLVGVHGGLKWILTYAANTGVGFTGGNDLALMAIPEPATGVLVLLAGVLALRRRKA